MEKMLNNIVDAEKKFSDIMRNLKGLNTPLKDYVCDENGKLSDEKIESFSNKILTNIYTSDYIYEYVGIKDSYGRCLKDYIYLVLRAYNGYGNTVVTFADLLSKLKIIRGQFSFEQYKDQIQFENAEYREVQYNRHLEEDPYNDEEVPYVVPSGLFVDLNESYYYLTGKYYIDEHFDEIEKRVLAREKFDEEVKAFVDKKQAQLNLGIPSLEELDEKYKGEGREPLWNDDEYIPSPDEYYYYKEVRGYTLNDLGEHYNDEWDQHIDYEDEDELEACDDSEQDDVDEVVVYDEDIRDVRKEERINQWKNSIKDTEKFVEIYKEFRQLAFAVDLSYVQLENAMVYILAEDGKNKLNSTEDFLKVFIALDDAYMATKQIMN